jgi:hypothetical protein
MHTRTGCALYHPGFATSSMIMRATRAVPVMDRIRQAEGRRLTPSRTARRCSITYDYIRRPLEDQQLGDIVMPVTGMGVLCTALAGVFWQEVPRCRALPAARRSDHGTACPHGMTGA